MQEWLGSTPATVLYDQEHALLYGYNGGLSYADVESMPVSERIQWIHRLYDQKEKEKAAADGAKQGTQNSLLRKPNAGETYGMTPNEQINPGATRRLAQRQPAMTDHRAASTARSLRVRPLPNA